MAASPTVEEKVLGCDVMPLKDQDHVSFLHAPRSGFSLFLRERTKTVHFVRHAEGIHNAANRAAGSNAPTQASTPGSMALWDAPLTDVGRAQCIQMRQQKQNVLAQAELLVVSPLRRTLQTAELMFGAKDDVIAPPQTGPARVVVHHLCRERWGLYTCDGRRAISEQRKDTESSALLGASCDWSAAPGGSDKDNKWTPERESDEHCVERALAFLRWLSIQPETNIAVVTHSSFLRHLFNQFTGYTAKRDEAALQRLVGNAEVRSCTLCNHNCTSTMAERVKEDAGVWEKHTKTPNAATGVSAPDTDT